MYILHLALKMKWPMSTARRATDRGGGGGNGAGGGRSDGLGQRRAGTTFGAQFGHGVLGLVGSLLALLEVVLHLAVLGQVDRRYLLLHTRHPVGRRRVAAADT